METRPSVLEKTIAFIRSWWQWLLGIFGVIFVFFLSKKKSDEWSEYNKNAIKNLEGESESRSIAEKKTIAAEKESDAEFRDSVRELKEDLKKKREKIEKNKQSAVDSSEADGLGKSIADLTGAEHIKVDD